MSAWGDSEEIARKQLNLSDDYKLGMAAIEVSDIDLMYQEEIFDQMEGMGIDSSPEMAIEIIEKHITYIALPAGMFLVKMTAEGQPDVWGFVQQEEQK